MRLILITFFIHSFASFGQAQLPPFFSSWEFHSWAQENNAKTLFAERYFLDAYANNEYAELQGVFTRYFFNESRNVDSTADYYCVIRFPASDSLNHFIESYKKLMRAAISNEIEINRTWSDSSTYLGGLIKARYEDQPGHHSGANAVTDSAKTILYEGFSLLQNEFSGNDVYLQFWLSDQCRWEHNRMISQKSFYFWGDFWIPRISEMRYANLKSYERLNIDAVASYPDNYYESYDTSFFLNHIKWKPRLSEFSEESLRLYNLIKHQYTIEDSEAIGSFYQDSIGVYKRLVLKNEFRRFGKKRLNTACLIDTQRESPQITSKNLLDWDEEGLKQKSHPYYDAHEKHEVMLLTSEFIFRRDMTIREIRHFTRDPRSETIPYLTEYFDASGNLTAIEPILNYKRVRRNECFLTNSNGLLFLDDIPSKVHREGGTTTIINQNDMVLAVYGKGLLKLPNNHVLYVNGEELGDGLVEYKINY
ncbi:MAG: hypothetical protein ACFHU9_16415 [Fluviicola sp.]